MNSILRTLLVLFFLAAAGFAQTPNFSETKKKAEAGDATAQFTLGVMYKRGEVVAKDSDIAVKFFHLGALQGNADAQYSLGGMYAFGDGLEKDLVQAHVWYNIAAAKGHENSKKMLAIIRPSMTADQKAEAMKLARELFAKLPKGE